MKDILTYKLERLNGDIIKYRPFSRRDFKDLSVAATVATGKTLYTSISTFIQKCVVDDTDVSTLPYWDAAMLFVKARSVSVAEVVELKYDCKSPKPDNTICNNSVLAGMLLTEVFYTNANGAYDTIKLTDDVVFKMRYPNIVEYLQVTYESGLIGFDNEDTIASMIIAVYDNDDYDDRDTNPNFDAEAKQMIGNLPPMLFNKLLTWFKELPNIGVDVQVNCNSCGAKKVDRIRGLVDFFV